LEHPPLSSAASDLMSARCVAGTSGASHGHATMGKKRNASIVSRDAAMQRLAEDLRTNTSPMIILKCLKALKKGLDDHTKHGDAFAIGFLRAGGLSAIIRHLGAAPITLTPTVEQYIMRSRIPGEAARVLSALFHHCYGDLVAELRLATGVVEPLIDILRDAPLLSRCPVATALMALAEAQPAELTVMAEAGLMGLLLGICADVVEAPPATQLMEGLSGLTVMLVDAASVAAQDIERAIRSPDAARSFITLVILQVPLRCLHGCTIHAQNIGGHMDMRIRIHMRICVS
jgi:hypothetical protein